MRKWPCSEPNWAMGGPDSGNRCRDLLDLVCDSTGTKLRQALISGAKGAGHIDRTTAEAIEDYLELLS